MPKNREEARKRFAYQPNGVPCGVFLHTFLHRLWKSFALLCGKWERERGLAPGWLAPPCRCCPRRGRGGFGCRLTLPLWCPVGGLPSLSPADHAVSLPFRPLSPRPPSPPGKGETQSLFRRGLCPRHPGTEALAALAEPAKRGAWRFWLPVDFAAVVPEGVACFLCCLPTLPSVYFSAPYPPDPLPRRGRGRFFCFLMQGASPLASPGLNLRFAAKPTEFLYLERCRQPRRGGTGGDGTIRRTRRRRLRWSSPPGQIEQVPRGLAFFAACLPCLQCIFLPPIPPTPFPGGEGGDSKFISPGAEPPAPRH